MWKTEVLPQLDSSNLALLLHPGLNLGIMEEIEMGSLRPVHPSLSPGRREVLGQPPMSSCLSQAYSHLSLPKPGRWQDSDSDTG